MVVHSIWWEQSVYFFTISTDTKNILLVAISVQYKFVLSGPSSGGKNLAFGQSAVRADNRSARLVENRSGVCADSRSVVCTDDRSMVCTGSRSVVCTDNGSVVCADNRSFVCAGNRSVVCAHSRSVVPKCFSTRIGSKTELLTHLLDGSA